MRWDLPDWPKTSLEVLAVCLVLAPRQVDMNLQPAAGDGGDELRRAVPPASRCLPERLRL